MKDAIRSVAVLGAGTMGAQIAAHLANAGVPVRLLDLTADVARQGLKRATALKPDPFFTQEARSLISIGGFDRDLPSLSSADWIVEAIVEQPEVKRALLEKVDAARRPGSLVSSNTSGIPIATLAEGRSDDFRRHWLGTHFFNPPRYLHLIEIIPTAETSKAAVEQMSWFADHRLGKGVVVAKDTPNFIGNRIGLFGVMGILRALESGEFTIEEIDALTGPALGRPKSATFRTMDIAGIDVMAHVARNLTERLTDPESLRAFALPSVVTKLIERGWVGEKSGQGFYKKVGNDILTLEPATLEYRPRKAARIAPLEAAQSINDTRQRIRTLLLGRDKVGEFLRATLGETLVYTARVTPEIAHSIDDVDRAMQWGFAWELGPFEIWDAVGVSDLLQAMKLETPPRLVADLLASGRTRFRDDGVPPSGSDLQILKSANARQKVVASNPGASLVDLGDGVLAVDLHSKLNTIGADTVQMLMNGVKEASANFAALVVGTEAADFSAGANLMLLLLEAQEGNWDELDMMVRAFQGATSTLRYSSVPVITCPAGRTLAGGCEIVISGDRVQAASETYIGLVEVGVGLIPAGGGTTEMLARAMDKLPGRQADLLPFVQSVFETLGFAKVSSSAANARELGFLRDADAITMNRERLIADAKALALERVREGYQPPPRRSAIPVGGENVFAALKLGVHLAWRAGRLGDHDKVVGTALARILAGGSLPHQTTVSEQYLLDLEREAFLKLCGERKTLERIQYTLKTGKPLRN
jgi:3-hydroxyacyl-CoA dehydrogenase